ncbi:stage III sporulation protein AA [Abditibacterium utsteinense]|uniref:Stage III sporulation protein AA n=1 Tax=Abditibacterium utsteinense TaxID=1960156 RepID=A0A2S8SRC6_9BACT|nr:R3H domain-containing nucleic acid-binding protein [Abditibacterium utsteinense]PQV63361.1 stage III sporulation protein AA [Abditibacterium utsteinense]
MTPISPLVSSHESHIITDNLDELLAILPADLCAAISLSERPQLIEIVLDLGRKPEARFIGASHYLRDEPVSREELDAIEGNLGAFGDDNRAGLPATLHRISAMRNRRGLVVGLTLRVGRAVTGIVDILRDLIESGQSILLMGRPGLGKTTMLREIARVLADEGGKRVVIVDTSNEIAGDGDVPHPAIGRARRMQVPKVALQHDVMIEAVENHMPEVIVIDEIGRTEETLAARTIAERGVQLIATVHGNTLDNLIANPSMTDLIGGIQTVTLGDEEARRRRTQKTVSERKNPPTFDVVIEMIERDKIAVRRPVADVVDAILRGQIAAPEMRWRDENGEINIMEPAPIPEPPAPPSGHDFSGRTERYNGRSGAKNGRNAPQNGAPKERKPQSGTSEGIFFASKTSHVINPPIIERLPEANPAQNAQRDDENAFQSRWSEPELQTVIERLPSDEFEVALPSWQSQSVDMNKIRRVYPFGISRSRLARAAKHLGLSITPARTWNEADAVLMLSGEEGLPQSSSMLKEARELKLPIIGVGGNTYAQIVSRLNDLYDAPGEGGQLSTRDIAIKEAKDAASRVMLENSPFELRAQPKSLRRLQHQTVERYHLKSFSIGREPNRRVKIVPLGAK